jgi:periplasmic protein TonB
MAQRVALRTACVAGSVLLHLGLLLSGPASVSAPGSGSAERGVRLGMVVRLETPTRSTGTAAVPETTQRTDTPVMSKPAPRTPLQRAQPPLPLDLERLPPPGAGPVAQAGAPDADYLPSQLLTRGPAPQQTIDLFYPELAPSGHFRAVLTLFIDEGGVVQRVRVDAAEDSGLPALLEESARQTFLRSAFVPGELDGRAVRSQLRIEVEFATEPTGEHTQTASS